MSKKVAFNVCLMILFVLLLTSCQIKGYKNEVSEERGDSFVSQKSMANHSEFFVFSQIPEIDDYRRAKSAAFSSEQNEFIEVKRKMDDLKNIKMLDEAAIIVQDNIISKRDIENFKIVNDVIGKFVSAENSVPLKDDKLKFDIIELVRDIVLKTEVEMTVDMPSQEIISYEVEKGKYLFEQLDDEYKNTYIASVGMTEDEFMKSLEQESVYNWRVKVWRDEMFEKDKLKIEKGASENGLLPEEYFYDDYFEIKIDELVNKSKIEIVDPEIKALFGVE